MSRPEALLPSDIARAAQLLLQKHGQYAEITARRREEDLRKEGSFEAAEIWKEIANGIQLIRCEG